jgi:hypothetical protein
MSLVNFTTSITAIAVFPKNQQAAAAQHLDIPGSLDKYL